MSTLTFEGDFQRVKASALGEEKGNLRASERERGDV